ncbi:tRNA pseudouridine(13) synthase TruD [Thiomicrorhabdus xiamenensis]|uniref:tRNA pseudouridine synthase D n=1 Tax=Thiomicrorhabdus xiamenensis TaxID=2739063 RepID=A0A7D4NS23_9GAMM|nr:tRNA pseudouridine(13) synthase TruD [Thiomicrorhabdus xiamenensis]QKI90070.1 tRNA pseudouridine(13) synthase TruD [Thiomicrorhabdus xiamenensis]
MSKPTIDQADFSRLAYAISPPQLQAVFKEQPEDFQVQEMNPYTLSGEGEHLWLYLQKTGENSEWLAKEIARWAGVSRSAVGMAGQKDRHAVTRQWLSVHLPGKSDPDWSVWPHPQVQLIKSTRHNRKLQKGGLSGNRFIIRLRDLQSFAEQDPGKIIDELTARLETVKSEGVPNYFGPQRFGKNGNNIPKALQMLEGGQRVPRHKKSLYLSALRSWAFNCYVSERIEQGNWSRYLAGDVFQLEGSSRCFADDGSDNLPQRLEEGDIHPAGMLIGRMNAKTLLPEKAAVEVYQRWIEAFNAWREGLDKLGVQADYRALRLMPQELQWQWLPVNSQSGEQRLDLQLEFILPAGAFATMVLRELLIAKEPLRVYNDSEQSAGA